MRKLLLILLLMLSVITVADAAMLMPFGMESTSGQFRVASSSDTLGVQTQADWNEITTTALDYIKNKPSAITAKAYEGTTLRNAFPIFKTATVGSGVATVYFTDDGLSTGNSLCVGGIIKDSVNVVVNDSSSSFQTSWVWSNSDKTLTVTTNKYTGGVTGNLLNILNIVLGQSAANGAVAKIQVWCY